MPTSSATPDLTRELLLAGEVHYFRLDVDQWADRLDDVVDAGLTAVATYVPWLVHELPDGEVDLVGRTRPERDLGRFLDLCAERGLGVVARPGPFVMAELKQEGLPARLFADREHLVPPGWHGRRPAETVVDYAHPDYLLACRGWYEAVIPVLAQRTTSRGGPVVAVQLDNEIGMLPWVTNSPDLSDRTLARVVADAVAADGADAVRRTLGVDPDDPTTWASLRSPDEDVVLHLRRALGRTTRELHAEYVGVLADWARELGLDVPLMVNVHGCWGGDARMFPLGVSQLMRTWADRPDVLPGTDYYVGDLTLAKLPGLWASNAFVAATTAPGQATGCLEFETGTGDYGEALEVASGPEAPALKAQLLVAQGNAFLNQYLFTGGRNPRLDEPVGDGNDRIASTGERHGFAAPVDPEGRRSPGWEHLAGTTRALAADAALLRSARPLAAPVTLGFVPDHWMTEYRCPGSDRDAALVASLDRFRGSGPREVLTRALVLLGLAPDAVDLQRDLAGLGTDRVLALAPTPHLDADVQRQLAAWVRRGGRLLLHGPLPTTDLVGEPATQLVDALGVNPAAVVESSPTRFPSAVPADGRLPMAEVRVGFVQPLEVPDDADVLARVVGTGEPCVVRLAVGSGTVLVVAADLPCLLPVWDRLVDGLGARPHVRCESDVPGVVVVPTATPDGTQVVHAINVSPWAARVRLTRDGHPLHAPLHLPARTGTYLVQRPGEAEAELRFAGATGDVR